MFELPQFLQHHAMVVPREGFSPSVTRHKEQTTSPLLCCEGVFEPPNVLQRQA